MDENKDDLVSSVANQEKVDPLKIDGLGLQLRGLREQMKMPGPEFAQALGIDPSTLSKYELNKRSMPLALIEKLATLLKQPASAVLVWCIRDRFPELGTSPSEVAKFLDQALHRLESSLTKG